MAKKFKRITREFTAEEKRRHAEIRDSARHEFPPVEHECKSSPPDIPARMRAAREAQRLTWYAVAKKAGVPNSNTIRNIEQGKDVKLSSLRAVAEVLGLTLEITSSRSRRTYFATGSSPLSDYAIGSALRALDILFPIREDSRLAFAGW